MGMGCRTDEIFFNLVYCSTVVWQKLLCNDKTSVTLTSSHEVMPLLAAPGEGGRRASVDGAHKLSKNQLHIAI